LAIFAGSALQKNAEFRTRTEDRLTSLEATINAVRLKQLSYNPTDPQNATEAKMVPQPEGSEFAFFVVDGGLDAVVLDGEYMKNVIIRNSEIQYGGGPLVLESVYFVNCVFRSRFQLTPRGTGLGETILAAASVNYNYSVVRMLHQYYRYAPGTR
jgi:hypothetical protein